MAKVKAKYEKINGDSAIENGSDNQSCARSAVKNVRETGRTLVMTPLAVLVPVAGVGDEITIAVKPHKLTSRSEDMRDQLTSTRSSVW